MRIVQYLAFFTIVSSCIVSRVSMLFCPLADGVQVLSIEHSVKTASVCPAPVLRVLHAHGHTLLARGVADIPVGEGGRGVIRPPLVHAVVGVGGPEADGPGVDIPRILVMQILGDAVLLSPILECGQLGRLGDVFKSRKVCVTSVSIIKTLTCTHIHAQAMILVLLRRSILMFPYQGRSTCPRRHWRRCRPRPRSWRSWC